MLYKQLVTKSMIAMGLSCLSTLALASATLEIVNNTDEPSTCVTYGSGKCSATVLPKDGITPPHGKKTFGDGQLRIACYPNLNKCTAEIHMTDDCTGLVVATAEYNTGAKGQKAGIVSFTTMPGGKYVIDAPIGGSKVTINYRQ